MAVVREIRVDQVLLLAMLELMPLDGRAFRHDRRTDAEKESSFRDGCNHGCRENETVVSPGKSTASH
jgi:hypothetical protein